MVTQGQHTMAEFPGTGLALWVRILEGGDAYCGACVFHRYLSAITNDLMGRIIPKEIAVFVVGCMCNIGNHIVRVCVTIRLTL